MHEDNFIEWSILIGKLRGTLSSEEEQEFQAWWDASIRHRKYFERLGKLWNLGEECEFRVDVEAMIRDFDRHVEKRKKIAIRRRWIQVAAVVIPLIVLGAVVYWNRGMKPVEQVAVNTLLMPGESRAKLTLSDGRVVLLDKMQNDETMIDAGNSFIRRGEGRVTYVKGSEKSPGKVEYNVMEVPRGGEYVLELCDGTRVWLNSQTRLVYPTCFVGSERVIELDGEAYFQVARDTTMPFVVRVGKNAVRVYGTSFNVSAYREDANMITTLETGNVGLWVGEKEYRLVPGDQADVTVATGTVVKHKVNAEAYCSWRSGTFIFEEERLESILNRLSRWYNVDIFYQNESIKDLHFTGDLGRYEDFMEVLKLIGLTTNVEFVVNERNIIVKYK